jgi:hypothetical protein
MGTAEYMGVRQPFHPAPFQSHRSQLTLTVTSQFKCIGQQRKPCSERSSPGWSCGQWTAGLGCRIRIEQGGKHTSSGDSLDRGVPQSSDCTSPCSKHISQPRGGAQHGGYRRHRRGATLRRDPVSLESKYCTPPRYAWTGATWDATPAQEEGEPKGDMVKRDIKERTDWLHISLGVGESSLV